MKLEDKNASGKPTISVATYSHEPAMADSQQDKQEPDIHEKSHKSNGLHDNQMEANGDASAFKESVKHEPSLKIPRNASHSSEATVALGEDLSGQPNAVNISENFVLANQDQNGHITGTGVRLITSDIKEKPVIKVSEQKDSVFRDANAIYGKGERLPVPHAGAANSAGGQNVTGATIKKQEEVTTKKTNNQFKDWEDWDNSAFDYYDNKEETDKDDNKENKIGSSQDVHGKSSDRAMNDEPGDDIDDYYDSDEIDDEDDEYDDEDDLDDDEDEYDITKGKHKATTVQPEKIKKSQTKKPASSMKAQEVSPLEEVRRVDNSGSSKEIASSSEHQNHKPSVKKDLNNPAKFKKEENSAGHRKPEEASMPMNPVQNNAAAKSESNWVHSLPIQLNTESGPLTSPNPPPQGLDGSKEVTRTVAPSTPPTRASDDVSLALENMSKQKSEVNTGFILSFPLGRYTYI